LTIPEPDLHIPTLQLMADQPDGFIATSDLIVALDDLFEPRGADAAPLENRNDSHFSQKVRNLVSHRNYPTGLETKGLATYDEARAGWQITDLGRQTAG
jgi:hypothetical protein